MNYNTNSSKHLKNNLINIGYILQSGETLEIEKEYINEYVMNIVIVLYYIKNGKLPNFKNIDKVILNKDWFIVIDNKYNVNSCIITDDSSTLEEYEEYLDLVYEYLSYYDDYGHIKEEVNYCYKR